MHHMLFPATKIFFVFIILRFSENLIDNFYVSHSTPCYKNFFVFITVGITGVEFVSYRIMVAVKFERV